MDLIAHLTRQAPFSRATFGPGPRTKGVINHVRKELKEIETVYDSNDGSPELPPDFSVHMSAAIEWVDVAILALDGLTRAIWAAKPEWTADMVAEKAATLIVAKQGKNEKRNWPDWRTAPADEAIEHVRGTED